MSLVGFIRDFFHVPGNQILVAFAHGLVFFLMGFAVLLQSRHRRHTSDVTLTRSLAWLGLFGIVQAFAVWGTTFVPIQQTYLPATVVQALYSVQTFLVATASALLLHFGSSLWADTVGHQAPLRRVATWLAPACFVLWTVFYAVYWVRVPEEPFRLIGAAEVLARYGMAIPGAAITCIALVLQAREFHLLRMDHLVANLKWLTFSFGLYGATSVILIPDTGFGFAAVINRDAFLRVTGLPVDVLSGTAGLLIAFFAVRILEVFDIELGRRLAAARRMKVLLDERDRIARELHDGVIQSLYAIGLSLEAVLFSLERGDGKAREIVRSVMERLDETIQDMRGYVMDLKGYADHADLGELLRGLVDQLSEEYGLEIQLDYRPLEAGHFTPESRNHILQIIREAVSNAARHGKADRVRISLTNHNGPRMEIVDNGTGFDVSKVWAAETAEDGQRVHHGLRNMRQRAELLGGYLDVKSERGKGTKVIVKLPEEVRSHE